MSTDFSLPEGTHTVVIGLGDMNGIMRGKRIPASFWPTVCEDGIALSLAMFAIDMTCDVWDTPFVNFDNGYPDFHVMPLTQPVAVPWEPGVALCMGKAQQHDGSAIEIDPRQALQIQVARAAKMGYTVKVGTELEFYLLDPETKQPRDQGIGVYALNRAAELEHVLGPIRMEINEMGIPIEQSNPEYAPGQVEVNIRYDEALLAADRVIMFRNLVKELAFSKGYMATFMAKPFIEQSGNGFHTHYSLWKDGKNAFAKDGKLNDMGMSFLAGLQKSMPEMSLAGSTTPNAYRRRQPYTFCPTNASWGYDNRTVALRVIEGNDSAVRIEKRDAGADCNPYYLLATEIAAGLDGIEQNMKPPEPCMGNAYESEEFETLPTDLQTAIDLARNSDLMKSVIGEHRFEILAQQSERELEFMANQVTAVEIERYMGNF